jgi:hypothetical protein
LDAADRITETESESFQSLFTLELKNAMQWILKKKIHAMHAKTNSIKFNYRKEIPFTRVIVIQVDRMQFCRWRYCIQLFSQTVAKDSNDRHKE